MHSSFRDGFEKVAFLWANPKTFKDHLDVLKHYKMDKDPETYISALRDNLKMGRMGAEAKGTLDTYRAIMRRQIRSTSKNKAA